MNGAPQLIPFDVWDRGYNPWSSTVAIDPTKVSSVSHDRYRVRIVVDGVEYLRVCTDHPNGDWELCREAFKETMRELQEGS